MLFNGTLLAVPLLLQERNHQVTIEEEMVPIVPLAVLYDPEAAILHIRFTDEPVQYKRFSVGAVHHVDKKHRTVLIEFVGVSLAGDGVH